MSHSYLKRTHLLSSSLMATLFPWTRRFVTSMLTLTLRHFPHYTPLSATFTTKTSPIVVPMALPISLVLLLSGRLWICIQNGGLVRLISFGACSPLNSWRRISCFSKLQGESLKPSFYPFYPRTSPCTFHFLFPKYVLLCLTSISFSSFSLTSPTKYSCGRVFSLQGSCFPRSFAAFVLLLPKTMLSSSSSVKRASSIVFLVLLPYWFCLTSPNGGHYTLVRTLQDSHCIHMHKGKIARKTET